MCKPENSVIPCSAEINLNGIPTNRILTGINCTSETRKFRGNLTEILTEMLILYKQRPSYMRRPSYGQKLKQLFSLASERPRTVFECVFELCVYGHFLILYKHMDVAWTKITSFDWNFRFFS